MLDRTDKELLSFLAVAMVGMALFMCGCCPAQAVKQAETEMLLNEAHAKDATLPAEAREVGRVNWWAWSAQRYNLTGAKLPAEVEQGMRDNGILPEGYGE